MARLQEHYKINRDDTQSIYSNRWFAQTFTPRTSHNIKYVKLQVYKTGSPGDLNVKIYATSAGEPTGSALSSGILLEADIPTTSIWSKIILDTKYRLIASTQYAIVVYLDAGDTSNRVYWYADASSPTYTGGALVYSSNSGSSWTIYTTKDLMFQEWGAGGKRTDKTWEKWGW